jgi:hypothetical protein
MKFIEVVSLVSMSLTVLIVGCGKNDNSIGTGSESTKLYEVQRYSTIYGKWRGNRPIKTVSANEFRPGFKVYMDFTAKPNSVIFEATCISDDGKTVVVDALIPAVILNSSFKLNNGWFAQKPFLDSTACSLNVVAGIYEYRVNDNELSFEGYNLNFVRESFYEK